jgi:threonine 3-dehydrogenase
MRDLGMTEGFDVGLEISGIPTAINGMIETMNTGGRLALLGLCGKKVELDWDKIVLHGLFLKGIYGREMFATWYKMVTLIQSGLDINPVITHHFQADDFQQAFDIMLSGQCGKVILNWE